MVDRYALVAYEVDERLVPRALRTGIVFGADPTRQRGSIGHAPHQPGEQAPPEPGAYARHIADFIAGMTDRFALAEYRRLFDATPELR